MRLALALLLAVLLPGAAGAVELVLGATGETDYNTNVFGQAENAQADGNLRGGPILRLRDRTGQLTWDVSYLPSYQAFFRLSDIDSFYHLANGRLSWRPSARAEFYGSDNFSVQPVYDTAFTADQPTSLVQPFGAFSNTNVLQNFAEVGGRYSLTSRLLGEISFSNSLVDYEDDRFPDSISTNGQIFGVYQLRPADRVGGGFGVTVQRFSSQFTDTSGSNFYQLFGIWNHDFSPTMSLRINAGPTLVQPQGTDFATTFPGTPLFANPIPRQDGSQNPIRSQIDATGFASVANTCGNAQGVPVAEACIVYPFSTAAAGLDRTATVPLLGSAPDSGGTSITYFANVSLEKRWSWFQGRIAYVRSAATTAGLGQSNITDTVTLTGTWYPSPVWTLYFTGEYVRRETTGDQAQALTPVAADIVNLGPLASLPASVQPFCANFLGTCFLPTASALGKRYFTSSTGAVFSTYVASLQLNRTLTERSYLFGRFTYTRQISERNQLDTVSFDRFVFTLGFTYEFEPFHIFRM